jgi:predicted GH43/DUF377 family glycosyl hydrolase
LTPNVVFVEGWKPIGKDTFEIYYGAADSVIGVATVQVTPRSSASTSHHLK